MQKLLVGALFACLLGIMLGLLPVGEANAGLASIPDISASSDRQNLVTPVRVWRDCQRIARCYGCRPVYHCRSCSYQRQCYRGQCQWADVCVWGPYIPLAPKGVQVY